MSERRPTDPIASGLSDAMNHGFRGVERVAEALRESLELRAKSARPVTPPRATTTAAPAADPAGPTQRTTSSPQAKSAPASQTAGRASTARVGPSGALAVDLARIGAEMLDRVGEVAQDVARAIAGDAGHEPGDSPHEHLTLELVAGDEDGDDDEFTIWNTGALKLKGMTYRSTDFLGAEADIPAGQVTFDPPQIDEIPPRESTTVKVKLAVDERTPAGTYRGLVVAMPGDAYVVVTILVTASAETAVEPEEAACAPAEEATSA